MVECTGLENQQSRKALVGSNPTASATLQAAWLVSAAAAVFTLGCSSIPGETLASRSQQREVLARVLSLARQSDPQCKQQSVANTEVLDVHGDGRPAEERWTVEQCGRRIDYIVSFPPKKGPSFSVRPEP